jgi:predicted KAP-like P-loop ATPase
MEPSGRYRTDAPLDHEESDLFDRAPFANRIADTISTRTDPSSLVVAIYGPWGDGKTTVLNFIRNRLQKYPSVITVNFNPWRMDGEKALLQGFFEALAEALDRELTTKSEKVGDVLKRYGALLKAALEGGQMLHRGLVRSFPPYLSTN